ncbi:DUF2382 domain-containing protein [Lapillicoccus sp.]|uniref:DUF2382 domain-containing protein n=1 Tax=Lapillicoccus sp. TaxID=1909287 RepID=UPI0039837DB4
MLSTNQIDQVIGQPVHGSDQDKLGKVGTIYLDDVTGKPEWATVQTGLFGTKESFVPVADADFTEAGLTVPYTKEQVKNAPRVDAEQGHLSQDEEAELYRHYGLAYSEEKSDSGLPAGHDDHDHSDRAPAASAERGDRDGDGVFDDVQGRVEGRDTSGLTTDEAMTRSEEQLKVGTEKVATGKARLRKYVVTEEQTVTVPVTREEVRIEREPITEANAGKAMDGPAISEEEHEMTLTEERVVVQKEVVPIERVKLAKETVTEQQQVTEQVRKEQVETDSDAAAERKDGA